MHVAELWRKVYSGISMLNRSSPARASQLSIVWLAAVEKGMALASILVHLKLLSGERKHSSYLVNAGQVLTELTMTQSYCLTPC